MMYGAEANVMDTNGGLGFCPKAVCGALDWVVASIHSPCIPGLLTEKRSHPPVAGCGRKTLMWIASAIPSSRITAMTMTL